MLIKLLVKTFGSIWNLKNLCNNIKNPVTQRILIRIYNQYQNEHSSSIAWNSTFAGPPCFPHGMLSIFISGGATIGTNCVIFQQVTIGSNTLPSSKGFGAPKIGNNCYIGAGAKIIGNVEIGDNVRVGANAVVFEDIPSNSIVITTGQKITTRDTELDNRFYSYRDGWKYYANSNWLPVTDKGILTILTQGHK